MVGIGHSEEVSVFDSCYNSVQTFPSEHSIRDIVEYLFKKFENGFRCLFFALKQ